jgi:crossover junction endodeoxyribonuclease RuvC
MKSRTIGFDPGFDRLGIAVIDRIEGKEVLVFSTCVTTDKKDLFQNRIKQIGDTVSSLLDEWKPSMAAMEDLYYAKNVSTALPVAEVRGMITYLLSTRDIPLASYNPMTIKVAVGGYGRATKDDIHAMVKKLVMLSNKKRLDDEIDAIAVALTHLATARFPQAN